MSETPHEKVASRKRMPPEERRAQLLEIAVDVFAARGMGAARHAEIAERAGVAVSTVFVYFPTRENLVDDVLDTVAAFLLAELNRAHARDASCIAILQELGQRFMSLLVSHRSHILVWLEWGAAVREDVWPRYREFTEQAVAITTRTLERGQAEGLIDADADLESLARLFTSSSQSIARLQLGDVDRKTIRRFQETVMRSIFVDGSLG